MKHLSFFHRSIISATFVLLSGVLLSLAHAASSSPNTPALPAGATPANALAAGASEDSLTACLARIPKDATIGQRLIADKAAVETRGTGNRFRQP